MDVSAYQSYRDLASFCVIAATAAPGRSLAEVAAVIDSEIERFVARGPTLDEMERVTAQAEAHFVYRLQTVGGFGGKSDQLNAYNVMCGDPGYFRADLERYRRATAEAVRGAAERFLVPDRRVVLSVVPRGAAALALPDSLSTTVT